MATLPYLGMYVWALIGRFEASNPDCLMPVMSYPHLHGIILLDNG